MTTVDFTDWATGDLVLTVGGREYRSRPPSVDHAKAILALAVQLEVNLGLADGPLPADLQELYQQVASRPVCEVVFGEDVYGQMVEDGLDAKTMRRMGVYGVLYWSRGRENADTLAGLMWRQEAEQEAEEEAPKDPSPSTSGPSTE